MFVPDKCNLRPLVKCVLFLGATCSDPGYPAGGSITTNGFEQGGSIIFNCDRPGFSPDVTSIGCTSSLSWNGSVANCDGEFYSQLSK